jgi:hypothetical protein
MRLASLGQAFGTVAFIAALSACAAQNPPTVNPVAFSPLSSKITPLRLLQMQAAGLLPGPNPRPALERMLVQAQSQRPQARLRKNTGRIGIWATSTDDSDLIGLTENGRMQVASIDGRQNGCEYPIVVKVDRSRKVWVACEYDSLDSVDAPVRQEYSESGTLLAAYNGALACDPSEGCESSYAYGFDGAQSSSDVFVSLTFGYQYICPPSGGSCYYNYLSGFEWWPLGGSGSATIVNVGENCDPVCDTFYLDVDGKGNIWFDYYGIQGSASGYGLAEVTNPTTNPQLKPILVPGTFEYAGGVYVSNHGRVLNVTDQVAGTISQYALPLKPGGMPFNVFHLSATPVSGGFNKGDTKLVEACSSSSSGSGCLAIGHVKSGKFSYVTTSFQPGGAAYIPSDK